MRKCFETEKKNSDKKILAMKKYFAKRKSFKKAF